MLPESKESGYTVIGFKGFPAITSKERLGR
jgi:hypothetical protein